MLYPKSLDRLPFRRVCLDMDGVLCDFYAGVAQILRKEAEYDAYLAMPTPPESNDYEFFGIPKSQIIEAIDAAGEEFWENLPAYDWAHELVSLAIKAGDGVSFLTSCGRFRHAHIGKIRWLKKHGILTADTDVVLSHRKYLHAAKTDLLIDDHPGYLEKWDAAGGQSMLVARAWNGRRGLSECAILEGLHHLPSLTPRMSP